MRIKCKNKKIKIRNIILNYKKNTLLHINTLLMFYLFAKYLVFNIICIEF